MNNTKHHLEEPITGLYYGTKPDGTHTLTSKPRQALRFDSNSEAAQYRAQHLATEPAEIARVSA